METKAGESGVEGERERGAWDGVAQQKFRYLLTVHALMNQFRHCQILSHLKTLTLLLMHDFTEIQVL